MGEHHGNGKARRRGSKNIRPPSGTLRNSDLNFRADCAQITNHCGPGEIGFTCQLTVGHPDAAGVAEALRAWCRENKAARGGSQRRGKAHRHKPLDNPGLCREEYDTVRSSWQSDTFTQFGAVRSDLLQLAGYKPPGQRAHFGLSRGLECALRPLVNSSRQGRCNPRMRGPTSELPTGLSSPSAWL